MATTLTTASTVECGHPGGSLVTTSSGKLTVDKKPVLLATAITVVANCPMQGQVKCASVVAVGGVAAKLTVGDAPVLVDSVSITATTAAGATLPATITAGHELLTAAAKKVPA